MKKVFLLVVPVALLLLTGCPLQTEKPMDNGSYNIPTWMNGKWGTVLANYIVKVEKGKPGVATVIDPDSVGKAVPDTIIFSKVGDKVFASVYQKETDDSQAGYYVYLFKKISDTEIELKAVKANVVSSSASPAVIKKWLLENKDRPAIYDTTDITRFEKQP
ncbi:MAG: hypothetical protein JWO03_3658 [Bacteroidetes bacterium]|nr:hypothetical protein [Bacteroidota bacterium]